VVFAADGFLYKGFTQPRAVDDEGIVVVFHVHVFGCLGTATSAVV